MKSSRDIPPRVGMQFTFDRDEEYPRRRITSVRGGDIFTDVDEANGGQVASFGMWSGGCYEIEWTPPADDERRLFMEAARHCRVAIALDCAEFCSWRNGSDYDYVDLPTGAAIAESLALDGADYDNMPDFEELER